MKVSKASPTLLLACATGAPYTTATLTCRKAGTVPQEYLKITMQQVQISAFQTGGDGTQIEPLERVSMSYVRFAYDYSPQKADGSLGPVCHAGYDIGHNKKF